MAILGFGKPTPEDEALQDPDIQPSDAWNIPKGLAALGAMAPAAIIRLFHGTSKAAARAIQQHGFDPNRVGVGADLGTAAEGWYGKGMYFTERPSVAREYAGLVQDNFHFRHPQLRPTGGDTPGFRNAQMLETKVNDWDILDATSDRLAKERLASIMTKTPTDGRDFIQRRREWAQGVLDDALQSGKLGVKFSPHEIVIPDTRGLGFGVKKIRGRYADGDTIMGGIKQGKQIISPKHTADLMEP